MATRVEISENELLSELASMGPKPAPLEAMTTSQMCEALGLGRTVIKKRLSQLRAEGRLEVWQAQFIDASGRTQSVPAYTIKPLPKRKR